MKLYADQETFVTKLASKIYNGIKKVVGQFPTGGGKTVVFSAISKRYITKSSKHVLILVHRKELLEQTRQTGYNSFELICQPIKAGMRFIPKAELYVGMVESANRRMEKLKELGTDLGLVIVDECHRLEFNKVVDRAKELWPNIIVIGFTATPLTASKKKPLKLYYDDIVCGADIPELIATGRLCQNITWAPKETVDRMELAIKNGEFEDSAMAIQFSKTKYIHNTVLAYEKWGKGTKTIIFNVNKEHSKVVANAFVEAGYNCKHLDSDTTPLERKRILHWFKNNADAILCNVGIATTGFDEPTIETVIVNKATMSMPLWLQMCGRGSRIVANRKSAFTIIDMGGNAISHGDWCDSRDWKEIFFNPPVPGKATSAPVKSCPNCDAIIPASSKICKYCGFIYADKSIPVEIELRDFVIVTKGIDVDKIVRENAERKKFYPFFKIGNDLAYEAKRNIPVMSNDFATFILQIYLELGKEAINKQGKKFTQFWQAKARDHLFTQLKIHFPQWETDLIGLSIDKQLEKNLSLLENLKAIENLN